MNGSELKLWRERSGISQRDLAARLDVSDSAVNRWENGQDIPGPAQLLLGMLIHGRQPFGNVEDTTEAEAKHFWSLKLTLADWHKLEALATAGGFATVRDYLLSLIREHLHDMASGSVDATCSTPSLSVSTVISSATVPSAPLLPSEGAAIVPLPTANWSGSAGIKPEPPPAPRQRQAK